MLRPAQETWCPAAPTPTGSCRSADTSMRSSASKAAEPRPSGKSSLANLHGMELPLDIAAPKLEKPAQLGKVRGDIELLPDETLQQVGMIGKVVYDLRGRQPVVAELRLQVAHVVLSAVRPSGNEHGQQLASSAIKKRILTVSWQPAAGAAAIPPSASLEAIAGGVR